MKPLAKFVGAALVSALALLAAPTAQAQVGVNINIGAPAWGPQAPYGTQYYYIPEIDGYYDLYAQQYIVLQDGYWVPLPQLYGYDPYQFHPVAIQYRGCEPWRQSSYYHQHYAYQPYRSYGRGGNGYYSNGYGRGGYYGGGRGYNNRGYNNRGRNNGGYGYGGGNDNDGGGNYGNGPRGNQPRAGGGNGYSYGPRPDQTPYPGGNPRSGQPQPPQAGGNGSYGSAGNGPGNSPDRQDNNGRHGRD